MKLITLIENTSEDSNLLNEHGLSIYFEIGDSKYLLDAGQSDKFISNALKLGVDLPNVDYAIISHNHYDHIGGLKYFLEINNKAKVYIKAEAFQTSYHRLGFIKKELSYNYDFFDKYKDRIILISEEIVLPENVHILPIIRPDSRYVCKDRNMFMKVNNQYINDNFAHELYVAIDNNNLTILSSCSHNGIINILNEAVEKFGKSVNYIIGGLHMMGSFGSNSINCTNEFIDMTAKAMMSDSLKVVYTGHCTGIKAFRQLQKLLGEKLEYLNTGKVIIID